MLKSRKRKFASFFPVLCSVILAIVTGCSNGGNNSSSDTAGVKKGPVDPGKTIEYSVLLPFNAATPDTNGPIFKKFEELTNTKITTNYVPAANLPDKVNATLASGDMPDILVSFQGSGYSGNPSSIVNAARSGAFWEIGKYIDQFPNLKKSRNAASDKNISIDGKIYGLYKPQALSRKGFDVRTDWLDNVGLKLPTTTDELYQVLKAFTQQDPDRNGKDDTIGIVDRLNQAGMPESFDTLAAKFGVPNKFTVKDGKFTPDFMTPEYMNTLDFYHKLYAEKLLNSDFTYIKTNQVDEIYARGQAGVYIGNLDETPRWVSLFKNDPKAKIQPFVNLKGPGGDHAFASFGYWNYMLFTKSSIKTEDRLLEILSAIDRNSDFDKMKDLFQLGVDGFSYKMDNGKPVITDMKALNQTTTVQTLSAVKIPNRIDLIPDWQAKMQSEVDKNEQIAVANPAASLQSQTLDDHGAELTKIISDASVRYIIGELNKDSFQKEIEKWKNQGGLKALKELEDQYKKSNP